jgi:hypothetical protein
MTRIRGESTKEVIPASNVCMGFWCLGCNDIIGHQDVYMAHRRNPDICKKIAYWNNQLCNIL